jgi:hypothetical protein
MFQALVYRVLVLGFVVDARSCYIRQQVLLTIHVTKTTDANVKYQCLKLLNCLKAI